MPTLFDALTSYTIDLASRAGFVWERATGRYRSLATGRFVSERTLMNVAERFTATYTAPNIDAMTDRFINGDITLAQWQERMALEMKQSYIVNLQIGRGGQAATTFSDYGRIGGRLNFEYRKLNDFAAAIERGELSEAQIRQRAAMYAEGARTAYFDGLTAAKGEAGYTEERRVLQPAEHCESCVSYASEGWQPLHYFPPPGIASECLHNCKCRLEYRKGPEGNVQ